MVTVEELVVKATPDGISEVNEGLQGMENQMEDTADNVEETSSNLDEAARGFKGAMSATIAGLGVATAGLLTQVPIIDETIGTIAGGVDVLVQKLDKDLRPSVTQLNEDLRETKAEAREQESFFEAQRKLFNGYTQAVKDFIASGVQQQLKDIFGIDLGIETVKFLTVGGADPEKVAENIRRGIVDTWSRLRRQTRTKFNEISNEIVTRWRRFTDNLQAELNQFTDNTVSQIKSLWPRTKKWWNRLKKQALKKLDELKEGAKQRGRDLVTGFAEGIRDNDSIAISAVSGLVGEIRDRLPSSPAETGPLSDLDQTGPGMVDTFAGGINNQTSATKPVSDRTMDQRASAAIGRTDNRTIISIDGREVERATETYRDNGTDLRGRYG